MNTLENSSSNDNDFDSALKNKGFLLLDQLFIKNGWHLQYNEYNWISYTKLGDETSSFDIKIYSDKIAVSVQIKNSIYQYNTTFKSYHEATDYVESKFFDYIK